MKECESLFWFSFDWVLYQGTTYLMTKESKRKWNLKIMWGHLSSAPIVTKALTYRLIWRDMWELTQEKSHSSAQSVTRLSHKKAIWKLIMTDTTQKKCKVSGADIVTRHSPQKVIWRIMRELTLGKSLSSASNATSALHILVPWRNIQKVCMQEWKP